MRAPAPLLVLLVLGAALAGCAVPGADVDTNALPGVSTVYDTSRAWSTPLSPALYEVLPGVETLVPSFDETPISVALHLPDVDGCDWGAESLPQTCRLPVVMDAGPYYADKIDQEKFRPPLVEWLVPRGYAVAYMSVRGTGESGGCMEFMSMSEQKDVDFVVTWLAQRPWSNGNVGMMGRSYDGTTPIMAAALGNPYLKTIVPISGVPSQPDLMFKNGTSEFRGPIMHSYVYWANYGVGLADGGERAHRAGHWSEQACDQFRQGVVEGPEAMLTGSGGSQYWQERELRPRVLESYNGSVWIIHGMEDWNVNPSQVVPWINQLQDAGIETKAWLGVWGHAYPDRSDEHRNVRWDWADQTVKWFDFYLKGVGEKPALDVEVEDRLYVWRAEASYPPRDATMVELELGAEGLRPMGNGTAGTATVAGTSLSDYVEASAVLVTTGTATRATSVRYTTASEPLEAPLRIAGLPQLHVTVTPSTPRGGYLFAELFDQYPDGRMVRAGWAAMDLRYHAGGNLEPAALVPGQPVVAMMEFEPTDTLIGKGHRLVLVLHKDGVEDVLPSPSPEVLRLSLGEGKSVLRLPAVDRPNVLQTYTPPVLEAAEG